MSYDQYNDLLAVDNELVRQQRDDAYLDQIKPELMGNQGALETLRFLTSSERPKENRYFNDFYISTGRLFSTTYLENAEDLDQEVMRLELALKIYSMAQPRSQRTVHDVADRHEIISQARLGLRRSMGITGTRTNLLKDSLNSIRHSIHSFTDAGAQSGGGGGLFRRALGKFGL